MTAGLVSGAGAAGAVVLVVVAVRISPGCGSDGSRGDKGRLVDIPEFELLILILGLRLKNCCSDQVYSPWSGEASAVLGSGGLCTRSVPPATAHFESGPPSRLHMRSYPSNSADAVDGRPLFRITGPLSQKRPARPPSGACRQASSRSQGYAIRAAPAATAPCSPRWCAAASAASWVPIEVLNELVSVGTLLGFGAVSVAVMLLRKRRPATPGASRIPGWVFGVPPASALLCAASSRPNGWSGISNVGAWLLLGFATPSCGAVSPPRAPASCRRRSPPGRRRRETPPTGHPGTPESGPRGRWCSPGPGCWWVRPGG